MTSAPLPVKLLLVDDLEENLLALEGLLRREGVELLRARSGPEALELLLAHDVALALLDVQMPEMDGFELAELMRGTDRTRHVPIIFLTAGSQDAKRVFRGYEVGAVDFLYKPLDPVLLGHKVTTFVELHRQRLERERLASELRDLLRMHEMFVAAVSHDLRSPLSTIVMGTSVLERELTDPSARRTLGRVRSSAQRMLAMLAQLYDLARARVGGGIPIDPRETDARALTERVVDELRLVYPGRRVVTDLGGGPATGVWDGERLAQVLANLVGNALRHGTREDDVRVTLHGSPSALVLEVRNGGEIDAELRPHLFDPFRRGSQLGSTESLGLGLYIVRQIVLAHGGSIELATSREAGTAFIVKLPWTSSGPHPAT